MSGYKKPTFWDDLLPRIFRKGQFSSFNKDQPKAIMITFPKKICVEETPLQKAYTDAECPDCGEPISATAVEGDECPNCGHVLTMNNFD